MIQANAGLVHTLFGDLQQLVAGQMKSVLDMAMSKERFGELPAEAQKALDEKFAASISLDSLTHTQNLLRTVITSEVPMRFVPIEDPEKRAAVTPHDRQVEVTPEGAE